MEKGKMHNIISAAIFAAIMAVLSQFTFPIGPVPITLQSFVCALAGGVLGRKWGGCLYRRMASTGTSWHSYPYHGQGWCRHLFLPCRRLLSGICGYGLGIRLPSGRKGSFSPPGFFRRAWPHLLLRFGYCLVHGIFPLWPWKRNAPVDGIDSYRIPLCGF